MKQKRNPTDWIQGHTVKLYKSRHVKDKSVRGRDLCEKDKSTSAVTSSLQLAVADSKLIGPSSDLLEKDHQYYKFSD
ncbi:unnamed protein product [Sphenostylis stenocarpa]|uniref:Uncharacterized protein n=1 Tax=Sphenostylis stenocarpa TaxID=92480 RepID=A0AA86SMD0_9FABA|nr:unnamed protein product [Sphenostylis stenocarpa]